MRATRRNSISERRDLSGLALRVTVIAFVLLAIIASTSDAFSRAQEPSLAVKIKVTPEANHAILLLHAVNTGSRPLILKFDTAQKYDFYAKDDNERIIWKWSYEKVFANVQTNKTLQPGQGIKAQARWNYVRNDGRHVKAGPYAIMGAIAAQPQHRYSEPTSIMVPSKETKAAPLHGQVSDMGERVYLLADDGTAYQIDDPGSIRRYSGRRIVVDEFSSEPIPGSVDRKITITSYRLSEASHSSR